MMEKVFAALGVSLKEILTMLSALYVILEYATISGFLHGGFVTLGEIFGYFGLNEVQSWLADFYAKVSSDDALPYGKAISFILLFVACFYFVTEYTRRTPTNLLPKASFLVWILWAASTDLFNKHLLFTSHTAVIILALLMILLCNLLKKESDTLARFVLASASCVAVPFYLVIAPVALLLGKTSNDGAAPRN